MNTPRLQSVKPTALTALIFLSLMLQLVIAIQARAQTLPPCKMPAVLTKADVWNQNVVVKVNIDPAYMQTERDALAAAFTNWNNAVGIYCPNIKFDTPTYSSTPIAGPGIAVDPQVAKYQIYRQAPPAHPTDRGTTNGAGSASYTFSAWTYLNPAVTSLNALRQLMAHEIGHTMGLGECESCGAKTSVTNTPALSYNDESNVDAPTTCDLVAMKQVMGCPVTGAASYSMPLNVTANGRTEHWTYRFGVNLQLQQVADNQVSITWSWRQGGYQPSIFDNPPDSCYQSTTAMSSSGAAITFAGGQSFNTSNSTLSTNYVLLYGHDFTGTYNGKLTSLGLTATASMNINVTASGCGTRSFALSPSSHNLNLK
ncbi:MAG: hypothetical protein JOZ52_11980 [Acidobacteria bacterium]|nr:hypothetical protein [Acidobacteriota bacterium]